MNGKDTTITSRFQKYFGIFVIGWLKNPILLKIRLSLS